VTAGRQFELQQAETMTESRGAIREEGPGSPQGAG
jgi:hypothetical protein